MKHIFLFSMVFTLLGFSIKVSFANCRPVRTGASAATTAMVAGVGALAWLRSVDLSSHWTTVLAQGQRLPFGMLAGLPVLEGDRVTVHYRLSASATTEMQYGALQSEITALERQLAQETNMGFNAGISQQNPDYQRLLALRRQANQVGQGILLPQSRVYRQVLVNHEALNRFFLELQADSAWVTRVSKISALRLRQITRASKNGIVLGAVALGLGLITLEEIQNCRLAARRNSELSQLSR